MASLSASISIQQHPAKVQFPPDRIAIVPGNVRRARLPDQTRRIAIG